MTIWTLIVWSLEYFEMIQKQKKGTLLFKAEFPFLWHQLFWMRSQICDIWALPIYKA